MYCEDLMIYSELNCGRAMNKEIINAHGGVVKNDYFISTCLGKPQKVFFLVAGPLKMGGGAKRVCH